MGKTADSLGPGARPDPVRSFNRWKKKHSHRQNQKKQLRKQLKKPEWQVERENISRLIQNYGKVRRGRGRAGVTVAGVFGEGEGRTCRWGPGLGLTLLLVLGVGEGSGVRDAAGGPVEVSRVVCRVSPPRTPALPCVRESDRNAGVPQGGGTPVVMITAMEE
jgi:hypothetical protein